MRYEVGQTIHTVYNTRRKITQILDLINIYRCGNAGFYSDSEIDHEATAKLTLPQPSKDMMRSGMRVIYRNGFERYALIETQTFNNNHGHVTTNISVYDIDLKNSKDIDFDIMQIWDGDTLIAQRTEKSEAELKKESLEKQIEELSATINVSVKQMDKLKEEIKSL